MLASRHTFCAEFRTIEGIITKREEHVVFVAEELSAGERGRRELSSTTPARARDVQSSRCREKSEEQKGAIGQKL